jgi:type I restriction enzyme R subunit
VIVDYANVFASLEKALALYGAGKDGSRPVKDKIELANTLRSAIAEATTFCASHGVVVSEIEATTVGSLARLESIDNAMDSLISPDQVRGEFFGHARFIATLYQAVKPDPAALEFASIVACFSTLADAIRAKLSPNPIDISSVLGKIGEVLDTSIIGHSIRQGAPPPMDLSKIDFESLSKRFSDSKHKNTELEVLKAAVRAKLEKLVLLNRTRTDFAEKFEELIEEYNSGSATIESLYNELLSLSKSLSEEEQRHIRENMSEEELVIFDILTRPSPSLSTQERDQVKKVATALLGKFKTLLVLNWRQKTVARSKLKIAIEDTLEAGLPDAYTTDLYTAKCAAVFEHVYESYPERDKGIYASVA